MISLYQHPWNIFTEYQFISRQLKQKDDELPAYVAVLASGTAAYEKQIRQAWDEFKRQPSQEHAREFIDLIKSLSAEHWPEVAAAVLGVPEITDEQAAALQTAIDEHHNFLENSLFPDIVKAVSGKKDLSSLDYRTVFLYAGALWSFGMLATVMFDGLSVRDLADLFMFTGPDDDHTCTGDNGCKRHVGNVYTVAQILADGIIPGQLRCLTNCRHMLLPIASPLKEKKKKHLGGKHDQRTHAGARGGFGAGDSSSVSDVASKFGVDIPKEHMGLISSITVGGSSYTKGTDIVLVADATSIQFVHEVGHVVFNAKHINPVLLYETSLFKGIAGKLGAKYSYDPRQIAIETFAEYYRRHIMEGVALPPRLEPLVYSSTELKHLQGKHDQRTHGRARGGVAGSTELGNALSAKTFYHFTFLDRAESIVSSGFRLSDGIFGRGIYLTESEGIEGTSKGYADTKLGVSISVKNPLRVEGFSSFSRWLDEKGIGEDENPSDVVLREGYDSIYVDFKSKPPYLVLLDVDSVDEVSILERGEPIVSMTKHLPGRHDQQTHAGTRGGVEVTTGAIRQSDLRADNAKSSEIANVLGAVGKDCYRNSVLAATVLEGVYVEGIAIDHKIGFPFEHGWVESEGAIVDPTLILLDNDLSYYSYVPIRKYTNEDVDTLMSKRRGKLTLPLLMSDRGSNEDVKAAWEYAISLLNTKTSEKHLPGRHDQKTHAGARGGADATAGASIEDLADPNSAVNRQARASWKDLTEEERLALMNPDAVDLAKRRELSRYRGAEFIPSRKMAGKPLDANAVDDITANAHDQIKQLQGALNPVTERLMTEYVDTHIKGALHAAIADGSLKASAEDIDTLVRANVDKLVFQEIESRKRQLGDHGIRHVVTNIENANKMLDELPGTTPMDKLLVAQVMTDHDMGYTAGVTTKSFEATKDHEAFSAKYVEAQDYANVFGDRAGELQEAVATHAEKDLDWSGKPVLSAIRTADNLALFSREKLPALFADVPGAMTELYKLQLASKEDGSEALPLVRDNLRKLVTDSEIDGRQKKELLMAVDEVGPMTPKFTIGMDAGEVTGFKFTKGIMEVDLASKPERDALNGVFDLGDRQFNKFLEDYDVEGTPADGLELVEKDSGEHVLRMRYDEVPAYTLGKELADLQELSVRPTIRYVVRHLKVPPTQAGRDALWPDIDELLRPRTTAAELELFHKYFNDNILDQYPLTDREHEFIKGATFKELTEFLEKHLPGRHAQQAHAPHAAAAGAPVTSEWMNDGGSALLMDDLKSLETTVERIAVISALVNQGITQEELVGLKGITLQPPEGYRLDEDGYFKVVDREYAEGEYVAGVYDPTTDVVHLGPATMLESDGWETVVHEVAHYVTLKPSEDDVYAVSTRMGASDVLLSQLERRNPTAVELIDYGLRDYSMKNKYELVADSFLVWKCGSEVQRRNLTKLWSDVGFEDMEAVFKQLGTMISVWELQARAVGNVIELIATPVVVDENLVKATPWYYVGVGKTLKHLGGRHDQRSHGRKRGGVVAEMQFTPSVVRDDLDPKYVDKAALDKYIENVNVTWLSGFECPGINTEEASRWKAHVVHSLSLETGLDDWRVNQLIRNWAYTSNDSDPLSLGLQMAAGELFGVGLSEYQTMRVTDEVAGWRKEAEAGPGGEMNLAIHRNAKSDGKILLKAMYDKTQQELKAAGIDKVVLYRGVREVIARADDILTDDANAMSSWSLNPDTAHGFAIEYITRGVVYQAEIPAERILATPKTGFGCMNEYEYIVLGLPEGQMDNVRVVFMEDIPIE